MAYENTFIFSYLSWPHDSKKTINAFKNSDHHLVFIFWGWSETKSTSFFISFDLVWNVFLKQYKLNKIEI